MDEKPINNSPSAPPKNTITLPGGVSSGEKGIYLQDVDIRDDHYPVYVSKGGWFHVIYGEGKAASARTIDEARDRAMKALKRPNISFDIPFDTFQVVRTDHDITGSTPVKELQFRRGHVVKKHAATGNAMVRWERGGGFHATTPEQVKFASPWETPGQDTWFQPLTEEQKKTMQELYLARAQADRAWRKFAEPLRIDARKKAEEIITAEEAK